MKKSILHISIFLMASTAFAERKVFKQIEEEAQVGNGTTHVLSYDDSLSKKNIEKLGLKELKDIRWDNCGPWKQVTSRQAGIRLIAKLEDNQDKTGVAKKLQTLYDKDKIKALVGEQSNNDVNCSTSYLNVYGTDGSLLKLRYELGD